MADIGSVSVYFAFFLALYTIFSSIYGIRSSNRDFLKSSNNSVHAISALLIIATICLLHELYYLNFNLKYVALNTSTDLPIIYRITALWAGQAGSLLLWCLILSIYTSLVTFYSLSQKRLLKPYVILTLVTVNTFFIFLITFVENPFHKLDFTPQQGTGLNPILQNGYMAIHPLTLYLGYVGVTIPFAFGIAALISGQLDDSWIRYSRKWTIFAWTLLSIGLLLGARWAYLELGWGGYWAWDPVENAAFMPWLAGTAFLHSIMIQEKKGMLKKWNLILVIITFFFSIFGTFITRSGILSSVHSFAQSDIGPLFLGFISFILIFSFMIFLYRINELESEDSFDSIVSRESAFIFNNLLFLGAAFTVFLGTVFPIISEAITGEKILVGAPYFNRVNVPIGLVLIFLMGVGPLISWRKATLKNLIKNFLFPIIFSLIVAVLLVVFGIKDVVAIISFSLCGFVTMTVLSEFYKGISVRSKRGENYVTALTTLISRNKRRYGGYIIHLGVVLIVVGITSSSVFVAQKEATLSIGESFKVNKYEIFFNDINSYTTDAKNATRAKLSVSENDKNVGYMYPEKNIYRYEGNREINQETEVALRSTLFDDLYIILSDFNRKGQATFMVFVNPMVSWIWCGGIVVVFGAIIILWPSFARERSEARERYEFSSGESKENI